MSYRPCKFPGLLTRMHIFCFQIFAGNNDQDSVVTHMFGCPILARCVRINPLEWKDKIALRFDLLGCPANTGMNGTVDTPSRYS